MRIIVIGATGTIGKEIVTALEGGHEIVPVGLRDEPRKRQQLAAQLAPEASQVRAVGVDRAQHADARFDILLGDAAFRDGHGIGRLHRAHYDRSCEPRRPGRARNKCPMHPARKGYTATAPYRFE